MQAEADSLRAELVALFERDDHDGDEGDHDEEGAVSARRARIAILLRYGGLPTPCQRTARLAGISGLKSARTGCQISRGFASEFRPFMNAKSRART